MALKIVFKNVFMRKHHNAFCSKSYIYIPIEIDGKQLFSKNLPESKNDQTRILIFYYNLISSYHIIDLYFVFLMKVRFGCKG